MLRAILRRDTSRPRSKASPAPSLPTVRALLREGIRVLQTRDGLRLSDEQIEERARNIVAGLLGNYRIRPIEAPKGVGEPTGSLGQMDLLEQLERRAEARNNGRPGRA
jgi:hypothetical protein